MELIRTCPSISCFMSYLDGLLCKETYTNHEEGNELLITWLFWNRKWWQNLTLRLKCSWIIVWILCNFFLKNKEFNFSFQHQINEGNRWDLEIECLSPEDMQLNLELIIFLFNSFMFNKSRLPLILISEKFIKTLVWPFEHRS